MNVQQTMEAVGTPVSTLMVPMSVSAEVATDYPVIVEFAMVNEVHAQFYSQFLMGRNG